MITCERCKTENLDGSQYCDECGAPLKPNDRPHVPFSASPAENNNGRKAVSGSLPPLELAPSQSGSIKTSAQVNQAARPHAWLVIERGSSAGKKFMLSEVESQIGRWDANGGIFPDVDLDSADPEAKVSRRHARITLKNGQYLLEDLGSTNGTYMNRGKRLKPGEPEPLSEGDEIIVGKTFLRFHIVR